MATEMPSGNQAIFDGVAPDSSFRNFAILVMCISVELSKSNRRAHCRCCLRHHDINDRVFQFEEKCNSRSPMLAKNLIESVIDTCCSIVLADAGQVGRIEKFPLQFTTRTKDRAGSAAASSQQRVSKRFRDVTFLRPFHGC